jgi:LysM repeat protein
MRIKQFHLISTTLILAFVIGCVSDKPEPIHTQSNINGLGQDLLSITNVEPGSAFEIGVYVVKMGDTLSHIAATFQVSIRDVLDLNPGLKPTNMKVGQEIRIYERKIQ